MRVFGLFLCAFFAASCTQEGADPDFSKTGGIRVPLQTTGSAGNVYRLNSALFDITGPVTHLAKGEDGWLEIFVTLPEGDYQVELRDGWQLVEVVDGYSEVPVDARLISENPLSIQITNQQVTDALFVFDLSGEGIAFGNGQGRIIIEVIESLCGNGVLDEGEECDWAMKGAFDCDRFCTGGNVCSANGDCFSGFCWDALCDDCEFEHNECRFGCTDDYGVCEGTCVEGIETCETTCEDQRLGCRDRCDPGFADCMAACSFFPPACAICFNDRRSCRRSCNEQLPVCNDACKDDSFGCFDSCEDREGDCRLGCDLNQDLCEGSCNTCAPCEAIEECKNAMLPEQGPI